MIAGSESSVRITSIPSGVGFRTNTGQYGVTPTHLDLPNGKTVTVTYKDPESKKVHSVTSTPTLHRAIVGNLILGGPIGLVVDFINPETRVHKDDIVLPLGMDGDLVE